MCVSSELKEEHFTALQFTLLLFEARSLLGNYYLLAAVDAIGYNIIKYKQNIAKHNSMICGGCIHKYENNLFVFDYILLIFYTTQRECFT
jgi:hypothetical protein